MADLGENASASEISENIGDVLASIRKLIAQDEANRSVTDPGQRLRQVAIDQAAAVRQSTATHPASQTAPQTMTRRIPQPPPLVLGDQEMVARRSAPRPRVASQQIPPAANEAAPLQRAMPAAASTAAPPHRATERRFPAPPPMQAATLRPEDLAPPPLHQAATSATAPADRDQPEPRPFRPREMRTDRQPAPAAEMQAGPMPSAAKIAPQRYRPEPQEQNDHEAAAPAGHNPIMAPADRLPDLQAGWQPDHVTADLPHIAEEEEGLSFVMAEEDMPPPAAASATEAAPITPAEDGEDGDLHLFTAPEEEMTTDRLLRELIRDAVREELQGELGSQFSRNLRRLVRSEIDRALRQSRKIA